MGGIGAATALGGEGLFYNPALIAKTPATEISLSANAYGFSRLTYESYYELSGPGGAESADLTSTDIVAFPTAASTVYPLELGGLQQAVALGIFVPFGRDLSGEAFFDPQRHPSSRLLKLSEQTEEYWFTGGYAIDLGPVLLGLTLIAQLAQFERSDGFTETEPGPALQLPQFFVENNTIKGQAVDLRAALGVATQLSWVKLGLMVLSPTVNAYGNASWRSQRNAADASGNQIQVFELKDVGAQWAQPLEVRAGVAFEMPGSFTVGADVNLSFPMTTKLLSYEPVQVDSMMVTDELYEEARPLNVNISVGAEVWVSESVGLRGGFFTRFDNLPRLASNDELQVQNDALRAGTADPFAVFVSTGAKTQDYGGTLGIAYVHGGARTDLGFTALITTGEHVSVLSQQDENGDRTDQLGRRNISGYTLLLSLGGTYGFGDSP